MRHLKKKEKTVKVNIKVPIMSSQKNSDKERSQFSIIFVLTSQYRSHSVPLDNAVHCPRCRNTFVITVVQHYDDTGWRTVSLCVMKLLVVERVFGTGIH
jgi:hypothetical protein